MRLHGKVRLRSINRKVNIMSSFRELANDWVLKAHIYEPGRPIEEVARELKLNPDKVIKLASNENSLSPSPRAIKAMIKAAAQMHRYPDGGAFYLKKNLAKKLKIDPSCLIIGNGSNEIIELLGHVFLDETSNIVMAERAFVVYRLVAEMFSATVESIPMFKFTHDLKSMATIINGDTKIVFIGNPNNPTGTMVDGKAIDIFMQSIPDHVVVCFDEAYIELLPENKQPDTLKYVKQGRNVIILRTFSKTYGLAGLRVGYGIAPQECIELLNKARQPFNVNAMALAAAQAALNDDVFVRRTRKLVTDGLHYFCKSFKAMKLEYIPSVANFVLLKTGNGREVYQKLMQHGVIVRPMDPYGMPEYIRVTVGTDKENRHFIKALVKVLK